MAGGWSQKVLHEFTVNCPEDRSIEHHDAKHYFEIRNVTEYDLRRGKLIQLFDSPNGNQWSGGHPMSLNTIKALRDALTDILAPLGL